MSKKSGGESNAQRSNAKNPNNPAYPTRSRTGEPSSTRSTATTAGAAGRETVPRRSSVFRAQPDYVQRPRPSRTVASRARTPGLAFFRDRHSTQRRRRGQETGARTDSYVS
jgi:hypothetical protein